MVSFILILIFSGACSAGIADEGEYQTFSYDAPSEAEPVEGSTRPTATQEQPGIVSTSAVSATDVAIEKATQTDGLIINQPPPSIPERRRITVEWPPRIRVGDSDVVRFTIELDENGNINATAEVEGHETRSERVEIPNLYESHDIFLDASLDISGLEVVPDEVERRQLHPGYPVTFYWSISSKKVGEYRGSIGLDLVFIPKEGGKEEHRSLPPQLIEVQAVNLLGMSGQSARLLGGLGTLIGSILGLDNVFSWLIGMIRKRRSS